MLFRSGGSQILGLADRLNEELNIRVWVAEDPLTCVARGAGYVLENSATIDQFAVSLDRFARR